MLLTTKKVKLIRKKRFVVIPLNLDYKAFVVYIVILNISFDTKIYLSKKVQIAYLKVDEVYTKTSSKYANFVDVFSPKLAIEFFK